MSGDMAAGLTLGSLFDGLAGFPLAAAGLGIKTMWTSEIEPNCIEIAARHFPEAPCAPNNGYNCRHPKQEEKQNGVGCCFQWSCPLAIPADEEDCEKYGCEYEESEFVLVEAEVAAVAERSND